MCGIIGIINTNDSSLVKEQIYKIGHRGPDGSGIIELEHLVMGHTRLSIQDTTELGSQPMTSFCGRFTIVFNGEIYNTAHLIEQVEEISTALVGSSDTSVLLEFLANGIKKGIDFSRLLSSLDGIFAFALYDKYQRKVFLVRDHLGIKPLYYYFDEKNSVVTFCSELNGLIGISDLSLNVSIDVLARYLAFLWKPGDRELITDVNCIPSGCFLEICCNANIYLKSWYQLPLERRLSISTIPVRQLKSDLRQLLRSTVSSQLVSDVPVGCFLSGGVDSSAIAHFANQHRQDVSYFTIDQGDDSDDQVNDLHYAKRFAKDLGVDLNIVSMDKRDFVSDIEKMVANLNEPIADPAAINTYYICELARSQGIKVMLSGTGGDDVFSGYRRHFVARYQRWSRSIACFSRPTEDLIKLLGYNNRRLEKFNFGISGNENVQILRSYFWTDPEIINKIIRSTDQRGKDYEIESPMNEYLNNLPEGLSCLQKSLLLDQKFFMTNHNLIYSDRMSMSAGVELRVPFLSKDILEFGAQIPDKYLQRGLSGKWILKQSMKGLLPNYVLNRSKTGFGLPVRSWMQQAIHQLRDTYFSKESIDESGLFDYEVLNDIIKLVEAGSKKYSYTMLAILCAEIWFKLFVLKSKSHY